MVDFGQALLALKQGKKVARNGWNGKGMWITLSAPKSSHFVHAGEGNYSKVTTDQPYVLMYTADETFQPGWLASQADLLAEDWEVLS